jgi:hypothetical protein
MNRTQRRNMAKAIIKSRVPSKVATRYTSQLASYKEQDLDQLNMALAEVVAGNVKMSKTDLSALRDAIEFLMKQNNEESNNEQS